MLVKKEPKQYNTHDAEREYVAPWKLQKYVHFPVQTSANIDTRIISDYKQLRESCYDISALSTTNLNDAIVNLSNLFQIMRQRNNISTRRPLRW